MQTAYLGSVGYYRELLRGGGTIDLQAPYTKQSEVNRCWIDSPAGRLRLTVPVVNPHERTTVGELLISEHGNWRHRHWNALVSSYRQSPYFDYYEEDFRPFYHERRWERLADLNMEMHAVVMRLLDPFPLLEPERRRSGEYHQMFAARHGFLDDLSIVDLLFCLGPEAVYYL